MLKVFILFFSICTNFVLTHPLKSNEGQTSRVGQQPVGLVSPTLLIGLTWGLPILLKSQLTRERRPMVYILESPSPPAGMPSANRRREWTESEVALRACLFGLGEWRSTWSISPLLLKENLEHTTHSFQGGHANVHQLVSYAGLGCPCR